MNKIGLTGGIGSGKTTVSKIFEVLKVPIYNSDDRSKQILFSDDQVFSEVVEVFGEDVLSDGKLDKLKLRKLVFSHKEKLSQLNNILHPRVARDFEKWCEEHADKPYVLKESAIIFEHNIQNSLDATILVSAKVDIRLERVLVRDESMGRHAVVDIMESQLPEVTRKKLADHIIYNNEGDRLIPQVLALDKVLRG